MYLLRGFSFSINFLAILVGFFLIVMTNKNEKFIISLASDYKYWSFFSAFAPSLIISIINTAIPSLTKFHSKIEKWDYAETQIKNEIWRSYVSKMLNLFLFVMLNLSSTFKGVNAFFGMESDESVTCQQDVASLNIIKLALTEIVILLIS